MECYLCKRNISEIDYREVNTLRRFISGLGKIRPRKKSGLCATHQRSVARNVKRARHLGLLSATSK
ncbi:MAG: 30S ribosomal protein S18 [Candidatus Wildermuthbacteria bacterium]|nr:30S ribosomal protein S18 [Candidatus Wildermuthbacteria bacterium]